MDYPKYMVFDLETENHTLCGRKASPFDPRNFIVATGYRIKDEPITGIYYTDVKDKYDMMPDIPEDTKYLVGLNIKFDLLHTWTFPQVQKYIRNSGKIWCCQLAEYCLGGMTQDVQTVSMDKIVGKYGGNKKLDEVKEMWEQGYLTSQIDRDMLMKYLLEVGDIPNTELIFLGQYKKAVELGMLTVLEQRMESLLCTTEMEFNGLKIDLDVAFKNAAKLRADIADVRKILDKYTQGLPEELEFKWSSNQHKSALFYGGAVTYKYRGDVLDDGGQPVRFKGGQHKGEIKTKIYETYHIFPRRYVPNPERASSLKDARGQPFYSTNDDALDELAAINPNDELIKAFRRYQLLTKDLSTYYIAKNSKGELTGLLTHVNPADKFIHHNLHHVRTVTGRLSSTSPNLQNIPRDDEDETGQAKSRVKEMMVSRFGKDGVIIEADYSQLEVVVQGCLTNDKQLCEDLRNRIDFHCKRLSVKLGEPYEQVKYRAKTDSPDNPYYKEYHKMRSNAKKFSFQRSYGAGKFKIAASTGMSLKDVEELMEVEDKLYSGVSAYYERVTEEIQNSSLKHFVFKPALGRSIRVGQYVSPSGTRYTFEQQEAPDFLKKKGVDFSFSPTCIKNYPVQGTGGEMVETVLGRLFRHFMKKNNYDGKAFLINTVHDCVWIDTHKDVEMEVAKDIKPIMESIPQIYKELYNWDITVPFPVEIEAGESLFTKHVIEVK